VKKLVGERVLCQVTAFSKLRRWLDVVEVTTKLENVMVPSNSNSTTDEACHKSASNNNGTTITDPVCRPLDLFSSKLNGELVERLFDLARSVLTERQKFLLVSAVQELRWNSMTLTRLCERLSRELRMSYSTVKWNMRRLAAMRLLSGGTENSKGTRAQLTALGYLVASTLTLNESKSTCNGEKEATST
jgi:DNA-binding protein Fis